MTEFEKELKIRICDIICSGKCEGRWASCKMVNSVMDLVKEKINDYRSALTDADEIICRLCREINPHHKDCNMCDEMKNIKELIDMVCPERYLNKEPVKCDKTENLIKEKDQVWIKNSALEDARAFFTSCFRSNENSVGMVSGMMDPLKFSKLRDLYENAVSAIERWVLEFYGTGERNR